jgi:hypothetical protein
LSTRWNTAAGLLVAIRAAVAERRRLMHAPAINPDTP